MRLDVAFLDRGHPLRVQRVDDMQKRRVFLLGRRRWNQFDDGLHRAFFQHARRLALVRRDRSFLPLDCASRARCARASARSCSPRRSVPWCAATTPDSSASPCRDPTCVNVTQFGQLAFVPTGALNPLPGLHGFRALADAANDLADARRIAQIDRVEFVQAAVGVVSMAVDQSRRRCSPVQIDDPRIRTSPRADIDIRTDRGNSSTDPDRDRLRNRIVRIDSQKCSVDENEVSRRPRRRILRHDPRRTLMRRNPDQPAYK